jgi:hypothetical protein
MRSIRRSVWYCLAAGLFAVGLLLASGPAAAAGRPQTCSGVFNSGFPTGAGVLSGTYTGNVTISGTCVVDAGPAVVDGNLTLLPGSTLVTAFSGEGSSLTVNGNTLVQDGATLLLGCRTTGAVPCLDDPTTPSHDTLSGNLIATQPLAVIVHNTTIQGHVSEHGGGGGATCGAMPGVFSILKFPVYSDYAADSIAGGLDVSGLDTCFLGIESDQIGGNLLVLNNQNADPDGVEILTDTISGNLVCEQNSMVWDSGDQPPQFLLYPRTWRPDTVNGQRVGQCVVAPALTLGGPSPGTF